MKNTTLAEIIELYDQGLTVLEISKKLSVKSPYVYNVLKEYLKEKEEGNEK